MSLLIQVRDISVTFTAGRLAFIFHGRDTKREDTQLVDPVIRDVVKITNERTNERANVPDIPRKKLSNLEFTE